MSVYTDRITEGLFRILEKKKQVDDVEVFGGDFTDGLTGDSNGNLRTVT